MRDTLTIQCYRNILPPIFRESLSGDPVSPGIRHTLQLHFLITIRAYNCAHEETDRTTAGNCM